MVEPFRITLPDADDLTDRLARIRTPAPWILGAGEDAVTIERIEELIAHWRTGYDWPAQERRLNALPHYRTVIDGTPLNFLHVPGTGPAPLPLLLANGWPSSFVEYLGVLDRLADPAAYGGDPADAFTVVVPAMPGYGFSAPRRDADRVTIAGLFDRLMTEQLGHRGYVAHGDDIGGGVVNRLGIHHAGTVRAIQTTNWLRPRPPETPEEEVFMAAEQRWEEERGAYAHVQATHPQTLAYALEDSPSGLAAWILEKFLTWSDPATRDRLSADDLLTNVMIYWMTRSIGTSIRLYGTDSMSPAKPVAVPASILFTREPELALPPESWLRRAYPQLTRIATAREGGHFLALESPEVFVTEVREAFRPFRD
jgi:pimeloyl-ACP methyl ester carboxylesterase